MSFFGCTRRITLVMCLGGLLLVHPMAASAQSKGAQLRSLLSRGTLKAEVLEPWSPPRLVALSQRVQDAAQKDPAWWRDRALHGTPGAPLPYDPKLGLTEAEYREFLGLADSIVMKPVRKTTLVVVSTPRGWRFGAATGVPVLRGVEIDTLEDRIHAPVGVLEAAEPVEESAHQTATGAWSGPRWRLKNVDEATASGIDAQFAIGKHKATGRTVIFYDAKRVVGGKISTRDKLFLRILPRSLPPKSKARKRA